jgi:hypothetical protein
MVIGSSEREIHVSGGLVPVFDAVQRAASSIGKTLEIYPATSSVMVRTRYGLQSVKLRISVIPQSNGCLIQIAGAADDIWGGGARKGADKFVAALNRELT